MIVDGFMRSGNTYLVALLRCSFLESTVEWGVSYPHRLSTLELGGIIQPIRDPIDCLTSYIIASKIYDNDFIEHSIKTYIEFTNASKNNVVADFKKFTTNPSGFLKGFETMFNQKINNFKDEEFNLTIADLSRGHSALHDPFTGRIPRDYPEIRKSVKERIKSSSSVQGAIDSYLAAMEQAQSSHYNAIINQGEMT